MWNNCSPGLQKAQVGWLGIWPWMQQPKIVASNLLYIGNAGGSTVFVGRVQTAGAVVFGRVSASKGKNIQWVNALRCNLVQQKFTIVKLTLLWCLRMGPWLLLVSPRSTDVWEPYVWCSLMKIVMIASHPWSYLPEFFFYDGKWLSVISTTKLKTKS